MQAKKPLPEALLKNAVLPLKDIGGI